MSLTKQKNVDLLVLGGGWSGLLAAYFFSKKGGSVLVLEKEGFVGGLARTMDIGGQKADIGGHALFIKKKENISFLKTIISERSCLLQNKKKTRIYIDGKYLSYPANVDFIWKLRKRYLLPVVCDLLKPKQNNQPANFEEWVKLHYGETLFNLVFKTYSKKVWGRSCGQLSHGWADTRIGKKGLGEFFLEKVVKERRRKYYYPCHGIGGLAEGLLLKMGSGFRLEKNAVLQRFQAVNSRLVGLRYAGQSGEVNVNFKELISTIPLTELIPLMPGGDRPELVRYAQGIHFRSLILVYVLIERPLASDWSWCYFPSEDIVFSRVHEPKYWSSEMGGKDRTLLCVEIFCDEGDSHWMMSQGELTRQVCDGLRRVGLLDRDESPQDYYIHRERYAYPLMYCGFERAVDGVRQWLRQYENCHLAGRSGTHSYFDMEECLEDVRRVVEKIY